VCSCVLSHLLGLRENDPYIERDTMSIGLYCSCIFVECNAGFVPSATLQWCWYCLMSGGRPGGTDLLVCVATMAWLKFWPMVAAVIHPYRRHFVCCGVSLFFSGTGTMIHSKTMLFCLRVSCRRLGLLPQQLSAGVVARI
jgi:hypothetical protein